MKESKKRSLTKAISWRLVGSVASITILYVFTHQIVFALGIGLLDFVVKLMLYYGHERVWTKIKWGEK